MYSMFLPRLSPTLISGSQAAKAERGMVVTERLPELVKRDSTGFVHVQDMLVKGWRIQASIPWTSTQNLVVWER